MVLRKFKKSTLLPKAEVLEPRVLFSADVAGVFLPLIDVEEVAVNDALLLPNNAHVADAVTELVFIDTRTPEYQFIIDDILKNRNPGSVDILLLKPDVDGVQQMSSFLSGFNGIESVHLISHGRDGAVLLPGDTSLTADSIQQFDNQFSNWADYLSEDADILIYGCDLAINDAGKTLIARIAEYTQADVAASDDTTGHVALDGDWKLEQQVGSIESDIILSVGAQLNYQYALPVPDDYPQFNYGSEHEVIQIDKAHSQTFKYGTSGSTWEIIGAEVSFFLEPGGPFGRYDLKIIDDSTGNVVAEDFKIFASGGTEWNETFTYNFNALLEGDKTYRLEVSTITANADKVYIRYEKSDEYDGGYLIFKNLDHETGWDMNFKLLPPVDTNNPPTLSIIYTEGSPLVLSEDDINGHVFAISDFGAIDPDTDDGPGSLTYFADMTSVSNYGLLVVKHPTDPAQDKTSQGPDAEVSFTAADLNAGRVVFTPATNNASSESIVFRVEDDENSTSADGILHIAIASVNDAPTLNMPHVSGNPLQIMDNLAEYRFASSDFGADDPDSSDPLSALTYYVNMAAVNDSAGVLTVMGDGVPDTTSLTSSVEVNFTEDDLTNNRVIFVPQENFAGLTGIDFRVEDFQGVTSDVETLSINISPFNDAPTLDIAYTSTLPLELTEDEPGEFGFSVADFGANDLDAEDDPGSLTYFVDMTSVSSQGLLTVKHPSDPGQDKTSQGSDSEVSFTEADLLANRVVFIPTTNNASNESIIFRVEDDESATSADDTLHITIAAANDAPRLDIVHTSAAPLGLSEDEANEHIFGVADFGANDPDADDSVSSLTFFVDMSSVSDQGILTVKHRTDPSQDKTSQGLDAEVSFTAIDLLAGRVVYIPNTNNAVSESIVFRVEDDENTTSFDDTLHILVTAANDTPTLDIAYTSLAPLRISEDEAGEYAITASDLGPLDPDTTDPLSSLTFFVDMDSVSNAGLLILKDPLGNPANDQTSQSHTGEISFTLDDLNANRLVFLPSTEVGAAEAVRFRVQDDESASSSVSILHLEIASVNDSPVVAATAVTVEEKIGSVTVDPTAIEITDVDNAVPSDISIQISLLPTKGYFELDGVRLTIGSFPYSDLSTKALVYFHDRVSEGTDTLGLNAVDTHGGITAGSLQVHIIRDNDAPIITGGSLLVNEGGSVLLNNAVSVIDEESSSDVLIWSILDHPSNGLLQGFDGIGDSVSETRLADLFGGVVYVHDDSENLTDSFRLQVRDEAGLTRHVTVPITITPVNDNSPVAVADSLTGVEGDVLSILSNGDTSVIDNDFDLDQPFDIVSASLVPVSGPDFGTLVFNSDGTFSYQHDGSDNLVDGFAYQLVDGNGTRSGTAMVSIVMTSINDAPTAEQSIGKQQAQEGQLYRFVLADSLFDDSDFADVLTTSVTQSDSSALPPWLTLVRNASGELALEGTPGNGDLGSITLRVQVADLAGAMSPPIEFELEVLNTNTAPEQIDLSNNTVSENMPGENIGILSVVDGDVGDTVSYSVNNPRFTIVNNVLKLTDASKLDFEHEQIIDLVITATDSADAFLEQTFAINVLDLNDSPKVGSVPDSPLILPGRPFTIPESTISDADGDAITYSAVLTDLQQLPDWLLFDPEAQTFTVVDESRSTTNLPVRVVAADGRGGEATMDLVLRFRVPQLGESQATVESSLPEVIPAQIEIPIDTTETKKEVEAVVVEKKTEPEIIESVEVAVASPDLQSLLGPVTEFSPQLFTTGVAEPARLVVPVVANVYEVVETLDLSTLLQDMDMTLRNGLNRFADAVDIEKEELAKQASERQALVGSTLGVTSGLSVGYLIWLIRGGTLLGSLMSSLPAWRFVDPLPILGEMADVNDESDESLETMVEKHSQNTRQDAAG